MHERTCVRCKKMISDRVRICPFCNMPNKIAATKTTAKCPKCKVELEKRPYRKFELYVCPSCRGMWLDTLEFEHLTSPKDVYSDDSLDSTYICDAPNGGGPLYVCVRCDNFMNRINFKSISGVLIDVCADHGVWLDEGELTRLRTFIASGGLDKAQDRQILRNRSGLERLATRLDNVEFMQNAMHRWSLKRIILSGGDILGGGKGGTDL